MHVEADGAAGLAAARRLRPVARRARRRPARPRRHRGLPAAAGERRLDPGAVRDRPRRRGRPHARPGAGRRRLRDQAVLARASWSPGCEPCCAAPRGGRPGERAAAAGWVARCDPAAAGACGDGAEVALTTTEFDLLAHLLRRPGPGVRARAAALPGLGLRGRGRHPHRRRPRRPAAGQARRPASPIRTVRGVGYSRGATVSDSEPGGAGAATLAAADRAGDLGRAVSVAVAGHRGRLRSAWCARPASRGPARPLAQQADVVADALGGRRRPRRPGGAGSGQRPPSALRDQGFDRR